MYQLHVFRDSAAVTRAERVREARFRYRVSDNASTDGYTNVLKYRFSKYSGKHSWLCLKLTYHLDTDSPPEVTRSPHCLLHHTTAAHHPRTAFPIHHCTNYTSVTNHSLHWLHSWLWSHTLQKPWTSPLSLLSIVSPHPVCLSPFPCLYLPFITWTVYSFLIVWCLPFWPCLPFDILSVCRLPRP